MGQILGRVVQESRGFVVVGDCRWHFRSVGQSDYYKAFYGNLVLINKAMDPDAVKLQELPDDHPDKLQSWLRMLDKMGVQGQEEMANRQRTAVSAGLEGVSLLSEECAQAGTDGHACSRDCFPNSYEAITFVPKKADERPQQGLIFIDSIPPVTITAIFGAIMALGDEGGRAARRVQTFPVGSGGADAPASGGNRVPRKAQRAATGAAESERGG